MCPNTLQEKFPNVSVIILTYNGSKYIKPLLKSLSDQSYPREKVEIIVIDNASTDNTLSLVGKYPRVRRIALGKNMGFAAGNNQALKYAQHDFLVFLNQDTICHHNWLGGLILGILGNKKIGACTSNMLLPETREFRYKDRYSPINSLYFYNLSPFGYGQYRKSTERQTVFPKIVSGCSFVIRRETVTKLGYLFDEQFGMYVEDTDLSFRIHNLGLKVCAIKDSVVYHLHHSNIRLNPTPLYIAARAIMNRVYVFFKNMEGVEFFLYFPLLFLGGMFKIISFRMKPYKKIVYFFPFVFFSTTCMILALFGLPKYLAKRRLILKNRCVHGFPILKLVLSKYMNEKSHYD